ncbi:helix-turn-helix domain-containing protein [Pelotomaculum propionicicum]|uniref:HTH-type transcriptional regulator ImmR n=1 Tax=Pelotomaculum propionicicum TaxID=258475 RepID=A0A4Y7RXH4_9FIRM|nr:helix-turn-helix transcriptional regulator [Pelotomaculum propionicicum]TEB13419.1 HTH-type transcriptional regulator ImmR [Pelotomaculum propionicicum]
MNFSRRLISLREQAGLTQEQLARKLNISRSALSLWELGKREPNHSTLQLLAKFFNVSIDYLLGNSDNHRTQKENTLEQQWPEGVKVLRRAQTKLTLEKRKKMLRLIEAYIEDEENEAPKNKK